MISVIIPAHNEAAVIGRCLSSVVTGTKTDEIEIIVVCNGCTDNTAAVARSFGPAVKVIETPIASKVRALNIGDSIASVFPRFYLDADIVLGWKDLNHLASKLKNEILAIAPRFQVKLEGCSWFAKAFYEINALLPAAEEGIGGSGVYGLSKEGRARFDRFPDVVSDDGFVRIQFSPDERLTVQDCYSTVHAPKTFWELVQIKTRSHLGNYQLRRLYPQLWVDNKGTSNWPVLCALSLRVWLWPKLAVYAIVKLLARYRAVVRLRRGDFSWERASTPRYLESSPKATVSY